MKFVWLCLLICTLLRSAAAQSKALETNYVQCMRDSSGRDIASRRVRTPTFKSAQGRRAYGVVSANVSSSAGCRNSTSIYIADRGGAFRVAFRQQPEPLPDGTVYDGNGIEAIRWSPSGQRLLVEVSQWTWGTDSSWFTKFVLIAPDRRGFRELPVLGTLAKQFRKECVRQVTSKGWLDERRIAIEIGPAKDVPDEDGTASVPSCVQQATSFTFDVETGSLVQRGSATDGKAANR